ncbi:MAG: 16S rRNA processing protein RimM, partial [Spirochaetota bacterium]
MDKLAVGIVSTTYGVRGYLKVKSLSGDTAHIVKLKDITLKNKTREIVFKVEEARAAGSFCLMKL